MWPHLSQGDPVHQRCPYIDPEMEDVRRGTASTQGSAPQDDPEPRLRQAPEEQTLLIQPSALSGRRPSVFFPYPAATGLQRGEGPGTPPPLPLRPRRVPTAPVDAKVS